MFPLLQQFCQNSHYPLPARNHILKSHILTLEPTLKWVIFSVWELLFFFRPMVYGDTSERRRETENESERLKARDGVRVWSYFWHVWVFLLTLTLTHSRFSCLLLFRMVGVKRVSFDLTLRFEGSCVRGRILMFVRFFFCVCAVDIPGIFPVVAMVSRGVLNNLPLTPNIRRVLGILSPSLHTLPVLSLELTSVHFQLRQLECREEAVTHSDRFIISGFAVVFLHHTSQRSSVSSSVSRRDWNVFDFFTFLRGKFPIR